MRYRKTFKLPFALWLAIAGLALSVAVFAQNTAPSQSTSPNSPSQAAPGATTSQPSTQAPAQPQAGSNSQSPQNNAQNNGQQSVEDELQLTPDQKQKIATVVSDENRQIEAVRNDSSMSLQQKQQKVMQIRQEGSPKIKAILTPEQLQKLTVIQERMRAQQQGAGQNAPQSAPQSGPQSSPQH